MNQKWQTNKRELFTSLLNKFSTGLADRTRNGSAAIHFIYRRLAKATLTNISKGA